MKSVTIALDKFGNPVQALEPSTTVSAGIAGTSARATLPTDSELVRVTTPANCFIKFGDGTVTATTADTPMLTGTEVFRVPAGATHVAVIQQGASTGTAYFTKMV